MIKNNEILTCEASSFSDELTELLELLFERGCSGIEPAHNLLGLAYGISSKIQTYLHNAEKQEEAEENAKHC